MCRFQQKDIRGRERETETESEGGSLPLGGRRNVFDGLAEEAEVGARFGLC